jgi:hypothetical protein
LFTGFLWDESKPQLKPSKPSCPSLLLRSSITKQKPVRTEGIKQVQAQQRNTMVERNRGQQEYLINHSTNQRTRPRNQPTPSHNPHIAILVILVCLVVSGGCPLQCFSKNLVLDGGEVCVGLNDPTKLDIEAESCLSPEAEADDRVKDRWEGEGKVVVPEVLRT